MTRRILLCAALLLSGADLHAQTPEPAETAGVRGAIRQERICPGGRVRVVAEGERVQGRCDGVMDERLLVWTAAESRRVPLATVDSLWVQRGGFGRGARTGALLGGAAAGLWGVVAFTSYCDGGRGCDVAVPLASVGAAALGALAGAVAGGVIGGTSPGWARLHPR